MALSIAPPVSVVPAYLAPIAPVLDTDRPLIEPVGFNQRDTFIGVTNGLQRENEIGPAGLDAFNTGLAGIGTSESVSLAGNLAASPLRDLSSSPGGQLPSSDQLDLFGSNLAASAGLGTLAHKGFASASSLSALSPGLSEYASIQGNSYQPFGSADSVSLFV